MVKILRPLTSFIGIVLIATLVFTWIAMMVALFVGLPITNFVFPESSLNSFLGTFNILFVVGIPLLMFVLLIMRVFLRSNYKPKWQLGLWVFWIVNLFSFLLVGVKTAKEFQHHEEVRLSDDSFRIPSDTLFIEMEKSPFRDAWFRIGEEFLVSDEDLVASSIRVVFERSTSDKVEVFQENESRGRSLAEASAMAESIDFNYRLEGNKLILPSHFIIKQGQKWRGQQVFFHILIPDGMYVERNRELSRNISGVSHDEEHKFPWHRYNKHIWKMGPNGMIAPDYIADYKKEFNLNSFSKIRIEGDVELDIKQGRRFFIQMDESDYQDDVEITRSGDRLDIFVEKDLRESVNIEIVMPVLKELWAINSEDIEIRDFDQDEMRIVNEGNGDVSIFSDIKNFDVQMNGNNDLEIRGDGDFLKAILSDDAKLDAEFFTVKKAKVDLQNHSSARISATDSLWQKINSSELVSRRNPVVIDEN